MSEPFQWKPHRTHRSEAASRKKAGHARAAGLPGPNFSDPHAVPNRHYVGGSTRLTPDEREKIRKLHREHGIGTAGLAERFGISQAAVKKILRPAAASQ